MLFNTVQYMFFLPVVVLINYMLPWYMDWYEQMAVDDLEKYHPRVAVYNEEQDVWGYTSYANVFTAQLKSNYTKMPDFPVWIRQAEE